MRPLNVFVLPCSAKKLDRAASARELYVGSMFRYSLPVIEREAELTAAWGYSTSVRVLSAKHGLLALDEEVEPYDQRIDGLDEAATAVLEALVCEQLTEVASLRDRVEISAFLPQAYLRVLAGAAALAEHAVTDVYEGCRGIGDMRHVIASIRDTHNDARPRLAWPRLVVSDPDLVVAVMDDWPVCRCGATPESGGYLPCDRDGNVVESSVLSLCRGCGRIIDGASYDRRADTMRVVGQVTPEQLEQARSVPWAS